MSQNQIGSARWSQRTLVSGQWTIWSSPVRRLSAAIELTAIKAAAISVIDGISPRETFSPAELAISRGALENPDTSIEIPWEEIGAIRSGKRSIVPVSFPIANRQSPIPDCSASQSPIKDQKSIFNDRWALRLGLNYARGVREQAAQALVRERSLAPFTAIHDLARRVPELRKDELTTLAEIGALNSVGSRSVISGQKESPIADCQLPNFI